jgi:hypothetical protein
MRAGIRLSGLLYALVGLVHLRRLLRRWPLLSAGFPLQALASLVFVFAGGLAPWAWRLPGPPQPNSPPGA